MPQKVTCRRINEGLQIRNGTIPTVAWNLHFMKQISTGLVFLVNDPSNKLTKYFYFCINRRNCRRRSVFLSDQSIRLKMKSQSYLTFTKIYIHGVFKSARFIPKITISFNTVWVFQSQAIFPIHKQVNETHKIGTDTFKFTTTRRFPVRETLTYRSYNDYRHRTS